MNLVLIIMYKIEIVIGFFSHFTPIMKRQIHTFYKHYPYGIEFKQKREMNWRKDISIPFKKHRKLMRKTWMLMYSSN